MSKDVEAAYKTSGVFIHGTLPPVPEDEGFSRKLDNLFTSSFPVAATYIYSGLPVKPYMDHGLILDPENVIVTDIHSEDSFSMRQMGGITTQKKPGSLSFSSIQDLQDHLLATRSDGKWLPLNEALINIQLESLLGFFAVAPLLPIECIEESRSRPVIAAWCIQQYIRQIHGRDLPVYQYSYDPLATGLKKADLKQRIMKEAIAANFEHNPLRKKALLSLLA